MIDEEKKNKKDILNHRLKDRYKNDIEYREKKKQIAINHYYTKKNAVDSSVHITIIKEHIVLYFI